MCLICSEVIMVLLGARRLAAAHAVEIGDVAWCLVTRAKQVLELKRAYCVLCLSVFNIFVYFPLFSDFNFFSNKKLINQTPIFKKKKH